jgi:hypothetical protein
MTMQHEVKELAPRINGRSARSRHDMGDLTDARSPGACQAGRR